MLMIFSLDVTSVKGKIMFLVYLLPNWNLFEQFKLQSDPFQTMKSDFLDVNFNWIKVSKRILIFQRFWYSPGCIQSAPSFSSVPCTRIRIQWLVFSFSDPFLHKLISHRDGWRVNSRTRTNSCSVIKTQCPTQLFLHLESRKVQVFENKNNNVATFTIRLSQVF